MAGSQTHGFDMVIEVSTATINNLVSGIFDNEGFLGSLFPDSYILERFDLATNFNRPPDVPASAENPVELIASLEFGEENTGQLRIVAGMVVDRSDEDMDLVQIDFKDHLFVCELSIDGTSIGLVNTFVANRLKEHSIPLIPIPVNRSSSDTLDITRADLKIIDDSTDEDGDALGVMLTFGGGTAGNLGAFNSAFAREGAGAAVAINFDWLCRNIGPRIEESIGLSEGAFSNCRFRGSHTIKDGVKLTELDIAPGDDNIQVSGKVKKSGTCYEASGEIGARIFVSIQAGELRVRFETDDPDIDVDIPWYCYLAGGILGALGGILIGVISSIVGAILIPLILWIAQSVIESTVSNIAGQVTDAIGGAGVTVPLVGVGNVLDRAFIDDLTITYDLFPEEYAEVKSEGNLTLRNGYFLDLDNGIVKSSNFSGAEFQLEGTHVGRKMKTLCGTSLGAGRLPDFSKARRFHLYRLTYGEVNEVPFDQVAVYVDFPLPWIEDKYVCSRRVFGAKTSDGCLSLFQIYHVDDSNYYIRYRTYQMESSTVRIVGSFRCRPAWANFEVAEINYTSAAELNSHFREKVQLEFDDKSLDLIDKVEAIRSERVDEKQGLQVALKSAIPAVDAKLEPLYGEALTLDKQFLDYHKAVGDWLERRVPERKSKTGHFRASVDGDAVVSSVNWSVDGHGLKPETEGEVRVQGEVFEYKTSGNYLTLSSNSGKEMEVPIKVIVVTEKGSVFTEIRCVPFKNDCGYTVRRIPLFMEYIEKFSSEFGIVKARSKKPELIVSR
ncbi:hypothetical protein [Marinilabilia salmonicolor]|jgi:hypothetical protein|uniref:Uncharacterized protein n=1 Tax=Marinilabilia salmonicolor TaxID=989 RepID=A0A2T0XSA9_9BACT|nr:hypothetical protein [Marinilabilia salmonicolor]PRZ01823.1 hypothetical protein BY457_102231 [Marinilabilia salmonicolor]RCW29845.1 hypothetical protein DFO77_12538 [Marinilabilia salmonicolor]